MSNPILSSCAIVLVTQDIRKTAGYYQAVLGFRAVEHYDQEEKFAALYRDVVEIILVQAKYGTVQSNRSNFGAGYDAYLVPENPAAVESLYLEILAKGGRVVQPPAITAYGSVEFVLEDIDGRSIGIGCIKDQETFFGSRN